MYHRISPFNIPRLPARFSSSSTFPPTPRQRILSMGRKFVPLLVLSTFLVWILGSGVHEQLGFTTFSNNHDFPDFAQYIHKRTISARDLALDEPDRRLIIVGDIHGMNHSLHDLLHKLSYKPSTDTLIHLGDIITKSPLSNSLSVLDFFTHPTHPHQPLFGVRGNHDQTVIEWRGWIDWVEGMVGGKAWLKQLERNFESKFGGPHDDDDDLKNKREGEMDMEKVGEWVEEELRKHRGGGKGRWWAKIPKGWEMFGEHYRVARALTPSQKAYLLSLPLILHLPSEHVYLVHAGLLPYDPERPISDKKQPLARLPVIPKLSTDSQLSGGGVDGLYGEGEAEQGYDEEAVKRREMRKAQEEALISDVKQNGDPWVVLNLRGVIDDTGKITRKAKAGTPWTKIWNKTMSRCSGYTSHLAPGQDDGEEGGGGVMGGGLPCLPSTVVYGHTASRGLDVNRWSVGLDSGCAKGGRLTAIVVESSSARVGEGERRRLVEGRSEGGQVVLGGSGGTRRNEEDEEEDADWLALEGERVRKERKDGVIPFGDSGRARVVSVQCRKP
ncbi:hypothetical protein JAAARDRAFT_658792 [Jaapia argillacea MUCL 33604]|uniref:Calcineurin-like phosphoesterase domain-containing protein n=1 Tax=Jaapia argillacea MUCL 33604 TaxID=933084 RepID=A0A067PWU6_9AGAM|nr:hypothetical protein JAAARDRAFT_658792 [Jaapia argillacea MUCL 33604]